MVSLWRSHSRSCTLELALTPAAIDLSAKLVGGTGATAVDSLQTPRLVLTCALLVVTCMAVFVVSACIPSDPKTYDLGFARDSDGRLYVFVPLCPGAMIEKVELSPDSQNVTAKDVAWSAQDPVGQARSGLFAVGDKHAFRRTIKPLTDLPKQFTISVLTNQTTLGGGSDLSRVRTASSAPSLIKSQLFSTDSGRIKTLGALQHEATSGSFCKDSG